MHNPGSVLQAYALQKYLSRQYNDSIVEIIDYQPEYFFNENSGVKYWLKKILFSKTYNSRAKKFNDFVINQMKLTEKYLTYKELSNAELKADYFIVGSDQLWNRDFPCGNDEAYYLSFVKNGKKISYSTSIGKKVLDANDISFITSRIQSFDYVSVREKSSAILLSKILSREVEFVCDPVFLLSAHEYMAFTTEESPVNRPYVMVYLAPHSPALDYLVDYYRKQGLYIVLVGGFSKRCSCDEHIIDVGPADFLNYIYHAETIISTSFHATAFSCIFERDFWTILPQTNGERILSLLEVLGIQNRAVSSDRLSIPESKPIDWSTVDKKLEAYTEQSKKYIFDSLSNQDR